MLLTPQHTVEEAIRSIEDRAAMLRLFADSIHTDSVADPAFFSGLADAVGEIEAIAQAVRRALDVDALGTEIRSEQHRNRKRAGGRDHA